MAALVAASRASFDRCVAATALLPDAALLPPDRISQCAQSHRQKLVQQRWSACARLAPLRVLEALQPKR